MINQVCRHADAVGVHSARLISASLPAPPPIDRDCAPLAGLAPQLRPSDTPGKHTCAGGCLPPPAAGAHRFVERAAVAIRPRADRQSSRAARRRIRRHESGEHKTHGQGCRLGLHRYREAAARRCAASGPAERSARSSPSTSCSRTAIAGCIGWPQCGQCSARRSRAIRRAISAA